MRISLRHMHCGETACPLGCRRDCIPAEAVFVNESETLDLLFVGEAPGKTEIARRRPFIGVSGSLLRRAATRAQTRPCNYGFDNVARCLPLDAGGEIRRPTSGEIHACLPFLLRDIARYDPRVIVLLGATALDALLPGNPNLQQQRGRYERVEIAGRQRWVLTTWHPAFVGRNKNMLPLFFDDVRFAFRLTDGWEPKAERRRLGTARLLDSIDGVASLVDTLTNRLQRDDRVALDVETRNLNKRYGNQLAMLQFCWDGETAYCVPFDHPATPFSVKQLNAVRLMLRRVFTGPVSFGSWVTHFGKFEQTQIGQHVLGRDDGVHRTFGNAPMLDTGAFAFLLDENKTLAGQGEGYGLKRLARHLLRFDYYDDATLMARASGDLLRLPLTSSVRIGEPGWVPNLTDYGAMDAYVTRRLFDALCEEADIQQYRATALRLLEFLFGPVFATLSRIERNGFWANLAHLKMLQEPRLSPIVGRLREIEKSLPTIPSAMAANEALVVRASGGNRPLFGMPWVFDLNKPAHVREWLVERCGLKPVGVGKSGVASVGKQFFQHYATVPEVRLVEEWRGLSKLSSSYVDQLIRYVDPRYRTTDSQDGRIRCDMHFTSTVTGRGSASNPNMQQQVRSDSAAKAAIKSIFQAEQPGLQASFRIDFQSGPPDLTARAATNVANALVQLDFRANESRWWCILSGCPELATIFNQGREALERYRREPTDANRIAADLGGDIHKQVAAMMFGVPIEKVDKAMRTGAKALNFGMIYGRGPVSIAAQIGKTRDEAQKLMDLFAARFPVGWDWLQRQPEVARSQWFVESPLGRRRRLPGYIVLSDDMSEDDRKLVSECDRMAKNSGIQSIASDASFIGACLFANYIETHDRSWLIQNVVHDSCVYQVPISELEESVALAEQTFTTDAMAYMTRHWGVRFACPLEVEFEIGTRWGELTKWDFTAQHLKQIVSSLAS